MSRERNGNTRVFARVLVPAAVPWPSATAAVPPPEPPRTVAPPPLPAVSQSAADYVDSLLADIRREPDRWADFIRFGSADDLSHRRPRCCSQSWWIHTFTPDRRLCMTCWPIIDQQFVLTTSIEV